MPLCRHREPCKKQTVRKPGANQGRAFFSCMRAEGPRGNPDANCGFFAWANERADAAASGNKRKQR